MMELKVSEWKEFRLDRLFSIRRGDRIVKNEDYFDEPVDDTYVYPVVTASATDNGVDGLYNKSNCEGHCIVSCGEANGMFTTWQARPFWGMDTVRIYQPIGFTMTEQQGLFFATLLSHNMYRFSYGRKAKPDNMYTLFLRLPIQHDTAGQPVIDPSRKYSDDGYVPDWDFMEQYMKSLNTQPLVTQRGGSASPTLGVDRWKEFQVGRLFRLEHGKANAGSVVDGDDCEYLGAKWNDCGVMKRCAYDIELAHDGNCVCFITNGQGSVGYAFYRSPNVPFIATIDLVMGYADFLTPAIGNFIATCLCLERPKYSHGRKWKTTLSTTMIRLPVQHDAAGQPVIDPSRKYSDDGCIPDWAFMEQYIGSLPGSDLI